MDSKSEKGKLIVIEGADGTGKYTQAQALVKWLNENNINTVYMEFPNYDTHFGSMVGQYLRGEFGKLKELLPEIPSLLFALDRYQFKTKIEGVLESGSYLIANRYIESNLGFQAAKFDGNEKEEFIKWLDQLEKRLPQTDIVFYLHMPVELSQKLISGRKDKDYLQGEKKDIHEQDEEFQERVSRTYLEIAKERKDKWIVIDCAQGDKVKDREEIQVEIQSKIKERFGI